MILLEDDFLGSLSIGQGSFKRYSPSKKSNLSKTTRHDFAKDTKVINKHMIVFSSVPKYQMLLRMKNNWIKMITTADLCKIGLEIRE